MKFQAQEWERGTIKTQDIVLDMENPRFAFRLLGGAGVTQYLWEKEGVSELAAKIAAYGGLYDNERIIVYKNEKGKFVVLEGNRRVLACQVLLRPGYFFVDDAEAEAVPKIDAETAARISQMEVSIVANRKAADPVIAGLHVFGRKEWHLLSRMYYAYSNYSSGIGVDSICEDLHCTKKDVFYYLRCYSAIDIARQSFADDYSKMEAMFEGDVDFKSFINVVLSSLIQKHFGSPFIWEDGRPNMLDHMDLVEKIGVVARHAFFNEDEVGHKAVRGPIEQYLKFAFRLDDRQDELPGLGGPKPYVPRTARDDSTPGHASSPVATPPEQSAAEGNAEKPLPDPPPEEKIAPPPAHGAPDVGKTDQTRPKLSPRPIPREIFFENLACPIADERLQQLTREIVSVSRRVKGLVDFPITASFLARALLEWSLLHHLKKHKLLGEAQAKFRCAADQYPGLSDLLSFADSVSEVRYFPRKIRAKCKFVRDHWLNDLNCNVHNDFGNSTAHRLASIAADIRPIVRWIFDGEDIPDDVETP